MNDLDDEIEFARNYAIEKHKSQSYGEHPYVFHLDQVFNVIKELNLGREYLIAAYLHDLLEDTDVTKEEIQRLFGRKVLAIVDAVSGFGENREECQKNIICKLERLPEAINLKMADRLVNIRSSKINRPSLFKRYKKEHQDFYQVFSKGMNVLMVEIEIALDETPNNLNNIKSKIKL